MKRLFWILAAASLALSACGGLKADKDASFPKDPEDVRREKRGKITGEEGWVLFGGGKKEDGAGTGGLPVNAYLWRAALDTLSFMPLASADPMGGVIITQWYQNPENPEERIKATVLILDSELRADALKVTVFRQTRKGNDWQDAEVSASTREDLENTILTRARQFRIKDARK